MDDKKPYVKCCHECGQELPYEDKCEVDGCTGDAQYEGWWRVIDGMGVKTGMIQVRRVCEAHKSLLIGSQDKALA